MKFMVCRQQFRDTLLKAVYVTLTTCKEANLFLYSSEIISCLSSYYSIMRDRLLEETMRKLYIDTTQLVHWEGFVAGIPRVMYELSRRFTDTDLSSVVYVSWVKEVGAYCEIDFSRRWTTGRGVFAIDIRPPALMTIKR